MPMGLVIQEKRKELGLTQEQVAKCLKVSIPAVSKWENGATNPDVSLLAPLARLLKTDVNTLLCFHEDMTRQEINLFCKEIGELVQSHGIHEGFAAAMQKIREYPHNESLLHVVTIQLDGLLAMSGLTTDEMRPYDEQIVAWYQRLSESADTIINNSANYMLASRYLRGGEYEKAQKALDLMPDKNDRIRDVADKFWLQVELDKQQGKSEKAMGNLQRELYMALNKVQILLYRMTDMELACGELPTAKKIADKSVEMVTLFDTWKYSAFFAPLQVAFAEKDAEKSISILKEMLSVMLEPWDADKTLLFHRMPAQAMNPKQMIPVVLSAMEKEPLLQDSAELQELIAKYERFKEETDDNSVAPVP